MNQIINIVLLVSMNSFLLCTYNDQKPVLAAETKLEGWHGHPDSLNTKPFDFFYMTGNGRASLKAREKRNSYMMESTCIDAAITAMKGNIAGKIFGELLPSGGPSDELSDYKKVQKFTINIGEMKVKECKAIYSEEKDFPGSAWKECECIAYTKIPGGRKKIILDNRLTHYD